MKLTHSCAGEIWLGLIGTGGPMVGVVASWQEQLEWGLRIASLAVGIAVGVFTVIGLRMRNK